MYSYKYVYLDKYTSDNFQIIFKSTYLNIHTNTHTYLKLFFDTGGGDEAAAGDAVREDAVELRLQAV